MTGILIVFIIWAVIAAAIGYAFAKIEQKVNGLPEPRTTSALLFSILLGPIGWIILAARSGLTYASLLREGVTRGQHRDKIGP